MKIKIRYQDDSDGRGWVAWVSSERGWQPVMGCESEEEIPELEDALICAPLTYLDPELYLGVEIVD